MLTFSFPFTFFSLIFLVKISLAVLDKKALYSNGLGPNFLYGDKLKDPSGTYRGIDVPQACKDYAAIQHSGDGAPYCQSAYMQAVNVSYDDCSVPYTLCYCSENKGIHMSLEAFIWQFGRTPNTLRDYTRFILSFPDTGNHAVTYTSVDDILLFGDQYSEAGMTVIVHELGHAIDKGISTSSAFKDAIDRDTCCPDDYALSNEVEDFAQITVCSLYYYLYNKYPAPSTSCMKNQLTTFQRNSRLKKKVMLKDKCDLNIRQQINHLKRDFNGQLLGRWVHHRSKISKTDLESGKLTSRNYEVTPLLKGVELPIIRPGAIPKNPKLGNHGYGAGSGMDSVDGDDDGTDAYPTPVDDVFWLPPTAVRRKRFGNVRDV